MFLSQNKQYPSALQCSNAPQSPQYPGILYYNLRNTLRNTLMTPQSIGLPLNYNQSCIKSTYRFIDLGIFRALIPFGSWKFFLNSSLTAHLKWNKSNLIESLKPSPGRCRPKKTNLHKCFSSGTPNARFAWIIFCSKSFQYLLMNISFLASYTKGCNWIE